MKRRKWSIRGKLTALLLLPLVSLAALWAYAAQLSLGNALQLRHEHTIGTRLAHPLGEVVVDLRTERRDALVATAAPGSDAAALRRDEAVTDTVVSAFLKQARSGGVRSAENDSVRTHVDAAQKALAGLPSVRQAVAARSLDADQVLAQYTVMDHAIAEALRAMTVLPNQKAQDFGEALYTMVPVGDIQTQEDALISAAAASPTHRLSPAAYSSVVQDIGAQRLLNEQAVAGLPTEQAKPFLQLAAPDGALAKVTALEEQLIAAGPNAKKLPFPISAWRSAFDAQNEASADLALKDISGVFERTGPPARRAVTELILAGVLGLVALIVSIVMSLRIGRSLVGDVGRLQQSARNLTDISLRDVVARLRRGETVDVRTERRRPVFVNRELAELGASFDALQLTAVELAEEDMRLHRGISDVFVNLARRSQTLVHRQLAMLDEMERHEEDPRSLEALFRLDQLATRMRRYAEGLIIVSGAPPGRLWRHAVPAVDVVRGAIAETEEYARVVVLPVPAVGIAGRAAADVIHLLAELIENAEVFSPSDSEVRVTLGTATGGLIVEIDDRGPGMPTKELAEANGRIVAPLDVSTLDSTRLGLVTVGRLADRHGIGVTLRQSPYGGVNAVVLLPQSLLEWGPKDTAVPAGPPREAVTARPTTWNRLAVEGQRLLGDPEEPRHDKPAGHAQGMPQPQPQPQPQPTPRHQPQRQERPRSPQQLPQPQQFPEPQQFTQASPLPHPQQRQPSQLSQSHQPAQLPQPQPQQPGRGQQPWTPQPPPQQPQSQPGPAHGPHTGGAPWQQQPPWTQGVPGLPAAPAAPGLPGAPGLPAAPSLPGLPDAGAEPDMIDGLPRRVPQASLARELAEEADEIQQARLMDWGHSAPGAARPRPPRPAGPRPGPGVPPGDPTGGPGGGPGAPYAPVPPAAGGPPYDPAGRPVQVRSLMSALQAGAARARADEVRPGGPRQNPPAGWAGIPPVPAPGGSEPAPSLHPDSLYPDQGRHGAR